MVGELRAAGYVAPSRAKALHRGFGAGTWEANLGQTSRTPGRESVYQLEYRVCGAVGYVALGLGGHRASGHPPLPTWFLRW